MCNLFLNITPSLQIFSKININVFGKTKFMTK